MPVQIEALSRAHDRAKFDCGEVSLNQYLHRLAHQHSERRVGRTFVAIEAGEPQILGFYTLATGSVEFENFSHEKKLPPRMPVPVVLLGRLAVDISRQGVGLGELLLYSALWRAQLVGKHAGVYAVEVHALHDRAAQFYLRRGFAPLPDDSKHLYMTLKDIEALHLDFQS